MACEILGCPGLPDDPHVISHGQCEAHFGASMARMSANRVREKEARKAARDAMPRCEVPKCNARGNHRCGSDGVLMCGRHVARAKANRVAAAGPLAIVQYLTGAAQDRESLLRFAQGAA